MTCAMLEAQLGKEIFPPAGSGALPAVPTAGPRANLPRTPTPTPRGVQLTRGPVDAARTGPLLDRQKCGACRSNTGEVIQMHVGLSEV